MTKKHLNHESHSAVVVFIGLTSRIWSLFACFFITNMYVRVAHKMMLEFLFHIAKRVTIILPEMGFSMDLWFSMFFCRCAVLCVNYSHGLLP